MFKCIINIVVTSLLLLLPILENYLREIWLVKIKQDQSLYQLQSKGKRMYYSAAKLFRRSQPEVFCKNFAFKSLAKFTGKHLCQSLFYNKVAGTVVFQLISQKIFRTPFLYNTSGAYDLICLICGAIEVM